MEKNLELPRFLKSTHSQMQIKEMIIMVLVLTVFFILVALFYFRISLGGLRESAAAGSRANAITLVSQLAGSPEFSCADSGIGLCIDADKLMALVSQRDSYSQFWSNEISGLRIEKVYPFSSNKTLCSYGNYPRCTTFEIIPNKKGSDIEEYSSYASICRKESGGGYLYSYCELGKIIVNVEK